MSATPTRALSSGSRLVRGSNVSENVVQLASLFRVEKITDSAGLDALHSAWNEMLGASVADCIFLTWEWLAAWWRHFGSEGTLAIFLVRFREEIIAIAPFRVRPASLREKPGMPVLEFLGSGHVGSDYLDVITRKGFETEALDALAGAFHANRATYAFRWTNVRSGDCTASRLLRILQKDGWSGDEIPINVCPYIPLEGCTWESYIGSLGAEHRYDFRRKHRRLCRDFQMEFLEADHAACREFIDRLIEQHVERWEGRGGSDAFHTDGLIEFHREITQTMLDRGWLRLYSLRLDSKPAAFLYGFLYHGKFSFYQSSFDPQYEKYSVGTVIMGLAIQRAIAEGASEFDFLHGDETYKQRWSRDSRSIARIELYPSGWRGSLTRGYVKAGRFALKMARNVLNTTPIT